MTSHTITAHLLPSMERVLLRGIQIDSDDDGYSWRLSASGPLHLLDQLAPVAGLPARVQISVDGFDFVFAVDPPERSRVFGNFSVSVKGTSVTSLLGAPYMPTTSWTNTSAMTAQQLVAQALEFTGVTVDWQISDWLVPAGAWTHSGTPLSVAQRIAEAAGAVLRSHRTDANLVFAPRYTTLPWNWGSAAPDVLMPGQIITQDTLQHIQQTEYNAVYVNGQGQHGVRGHVVRAGSAGDVLAAEIVDPLITHEVAARQRGSTILGAAAIRHKQPMTVPLLTGEAYPGLILPGYLLEVQEPSVTWRGVVRSISISENRPKVRQSLVVERL